MQADVIAEPVRPADPAGCKKVLALVASVYDVRVDDLVHVTRGPQDAAAARHVAIYLAHTVLSMNFADLASAFGRAPSTTLHAVRKVEAMRDDPKIDRILTWLEAILRVAPETSR